MNFVGRAARKLSVLAKLRGAERGLMIEAMALLALARIWLVATPFPKVAEKLGEACAPGDLDKGSVVGLSAADESVARSISVAIERAAKNVPFRAVCIQRAVAAKMMLRRRAIPCVLHFGVAKGGAGEQMRAHAWLDATHVPVTGYPISSDMREIACFV
jgi:hypothetical protein